MNEVIKPGSIKRNQCGCNRPGSGSEDPNNSNPFIFLHNDGRSNCSCDRCKIYHKTQFPSTYMKAGSIKNETDDYLYPVTNDSPFSNLEVTESEKFNDDSDEIKTNQQLGGFLNKIQSDILKGLYLVARVDYEKIRFN